MCIMLRINTDISEKMSIMMKITKVRNKYYNSHLLIFLTSILGMIK